MRTQSNLPFIVWTGGLVALPELRFTPSGLAVASIRLAGKKRVKDAQGQFTDGDAIYLEVKAWRELAEHACETLVRPGQKVTVTGDLEMRQFEVDGQKRTTYEITADTLAVDLQWSIYKEAPKADKPGTADDPWGTKGQSAEAPF